MKAQPISRWGEGPNRPGQKLWGQKIENSQSDGIAANHSRKLTVQLGFEQSVAPGGGSREDSMRSEGMNETPHQNF
jgi:hypothetical protein